MSVEIPELKRLVTSRELAIWEGRSGLPAALEEEYRVLWRGLANGTRPQARSTPLPCVNLGEDTGERVAYGCKSCGGSLRNIELKVYGCKVHGKCTLGKKVDGVECCAGCNEYSDHEPDPPPDPRNLVYQAEADEFLRTLEPYPEGKYAGRGITIAAGGNYWPSAYVTILMLRHFGCELPAVVGFLGNSGERDERYEKLLSPYGVEFVDIDQHHARAGRRVVKGFGTKLFLAVHSPFEEVLSLDPDNYPCADPTILFDDERYRSLGGIYWPDRDFTNTWTKWDLWGVERRGPCGLETGQYVLHKRLAWEPMRLAEWYDDRPEWCYGSTSGADGTEWANNGGDYGDKGPHRAAWAKLKRDYVVFNPICRHEKFAYLQPGPDGLTSLFVHRCHSKFSANGALTFPTTPQTAGVNTRGGFPMEKEAFQYLEELRRALE